MSDEPAEFLIISTIPAMAQSELNFESLFSANPKASGVIVDMAYRPRQTPLLSFVDQDSVYWKTIEGIQVLMEQGFEQFQLWTGRRAPRLTMSSRVLTEY